MTEPAKTNAARLLESRGVPHRVRVYDAGRAFHSADEAADLLGVPGASVLKTLVVLRETTGRAKPLLVLVPSDRQVDLKRLGRSIGERRLRMASQREAERITGLKVGGISALAVRAGAFEVLVDASAAGRDRIHVSAGGRGVDLELGVQDLLAATGGRLVDASGDTAAGIDGEGAPRRATPSVSTSADGSSSISDAGTGLGEAHGLVEVSKPERGDLP